MAYKKNKKAQNSQMAMISLVLIMLIGGIFAISNNNSNTDEKGATAIIPNNNNTIDVKGQNYQQRENKDVTELLKNQTGINNGNVISVGDCVDGSCSLKDVITNTTQEYQLSDLETYAGVLDSGEKITQIWFNNQFNVDGFDKHFQAVLIEDTNWNNYKVVWSVEDDVFVIPNLKKDTLSGFDINNPSFNIDGWYLQNTRFDEDSLIFYSSQSLDDNSIYSINSIVTIDNTGMIDIIKDLSYTTSGTSTSNICNLDNGKAKTINVNGNNNVINNCRSGRSGSSFKINFAISDNAKFSYDRIAVNGNTRTTGFNVVSVTKQEMTAVNGMDNKQAKILSKDKFDVVMNQGVGARAYTDFSDVNLNELLQNFDDNAISLWTDTINHNAYGLGTSNSEDFDYTDGFAIDGYFTTQDDISALEVGSYSFDSSNSKGLVMSDTGLVQVSGSQMVGENYGIFEFETANSSLSYSGTAYVINEVQENGQLVYLWDRVFAGMVNLFDYSFDYGLWVTDKATNGKFSPVDVYDSCGITGCNYGYVTTFTDSSSSTATLVTQKPSQNLLQYDGKDYWAFWKLENKGSSVGDGCLILDMPTNNLGRVPVSVCDSSIIGMNSYAQFKMIGADQE